MRYRICKKTVSGILLAVILMGLLSGCGAKTLSGEPLTLTVDSDASGERHWFVRYAEHGFLTHDVTERDDGKTDVVFTGLRKGTVKTTLFRAVSSGNSTASADDVYVVTLRVDRKGNVTQPQPYYGEYSVDCGVAVTGAQWRIRCSGTGDVHWVERQNPVRTKGDGMQDYSMEYRFTGKRFGAVHVQVLNDLPWRDASDKARDFWLFVDDEYNVSALQTTDFTSFSFRSHGSSSIHTVYSAETTVDGVRFSAYEATQRWSDEENDYVETRMNERIFDGGDDLYRTIAALFAQCSVPKWDGYHRSNTRVLDGTTFSFEAVLADGKTVSASGSNSFPDGYRTFNTALQTLVTVLETQKNT